MMYVGIEPAQGVLSKVQHSILTKNHAQAQERSHSVPPACMFYADRCRAFRPHVIWLSVDHV